MAGDLEAALRSVLGALEDGSVEPDVVRATIGEYVPDLRGSRELRDLGDKLRHGQPVPSVRQDLERRKRVVTLLEVGRWSAELATTRPGDPGTAASTETGHGHGVTVPTRFALASIDDEVPCDIEYWVSDAAEDADPIAVRGSVLGARQVSKLEAWEFWVPSGTNVVMRMLPGVARPVWLRFIGPQVSDYAHGYDIRTGRYSHSSFANLDFTGNEFLAVLLHEYVKDRERRGADDRESTAAVTRLATDMLAGRSLALSSRWRLCQVLASASPDDAVAEIRRIAVAGNSLSPLASRSLERLEGC